MDSRVCRECGRPAAKNGKRRGVQRYKTVCGVCFHKGYTQSPEAINRRRERNATAYRLRSIDPEHRRKRREYKRRPEVKARSLGYTYRGQHLKDCCERCGFEPEHPWQLQLDHVDGNRANNKRSNFQTLCANCHVLKTVMNGDWESPSRAPVSSLVEGQEDMFTDVDA